MRPIFPPSNIVRISATATPAFPEHASYLAATGQATWTLVVDVAAQGRMAAMNIRVDAVGKGALAAGIIVDLDGLAREQ